MMNTLECHQIEEVNGAGFWEDAGRALGYFVGLANGRIASTMTVPQGAELERRISEAQSLDSTGML